MQTILCSGRITFDVGQTVAKVKVTFDPYGTPTALAGTTQDSITKDPTQCDLTLTNANGLAFYNSNNIPVVVASPVSSVPNNVKVTVGNIATDSFELRAVRTETTAVSTSFTWVAVGVSEQ